MAKKFFYVCVGLFLLALSYHLGAKSATAQSVGNTLVAVERGNTTSGDTWVAFTSNGDMYLASGGWLNGPYSLSGNVFSGAPIPTLETSWGALKVKGR